MATEGQGRMEAEGDPQLQSLEVFRASFDESPIGQVVADPQGAILRVNTALASLGGYAVDELCGAPLLSVVHPEDRPAAHRALVDLAEGRGERVLLETRVVAKDGRAIWVHVTAGARRGADGAVAYLLGYVVDITARREAESDHHATETRYRRLFESATDGILILDAESLRVVDVNPVMVELAGHARQDLLGREPWQTGLFMDPEASQRCFTQLRAGDGFRCDELRLQTRDGRALEVEVVTCVYVVDGATVIQCSVRDVTARKRAELEHARLVTAIEQAAEAVVLTDAKGIIEYVNPAFTAISGYPREEALGVTPGFLRSGVQDDRTYRALWQTISSGGTWRGRLVNRRKDGAHFHADVTISPVRNAAGVITSFVAVERDVSATLALEAQFRQAQKMEAVGRLAGGVAHDFNNLLSVILSYAELLGVELNPNEPMHADVKEIRTAALRGADLTRQLLAFSRHQVLELKVLNINQSLEGMQNMLGRLLGADVELTLLPASGLWRVKADAGQFEQVVMNLVINARDAMPRGGKLTIETANVELDEDYARLHHDVRPGPYVELAVSDTGTGMDQETKARIFEPFFTTKEKGKGTGLGLSTVFGIVKQMLGHVFVYSEPEMGTTFKVYFPRTGAVAEVGPALSVEPEAPPASATILLVEDEEQLRVLARTILRREGYVVLDAPNGGEALLLAEQHPANIDLLLTDVVLPRMNGRQLAERLAPLRPSMKVLYMSGYTEDAILQHGIISSGVSFLQKPLTPASLRRKVREVLGAASGASARRSD